MYLPSRQNLVVVIIIVAIVLTVEPFCMICPLAPTILFTGILIFLLKMVSVLTRSYFSVVET
jgi:hypothetical protein